MVTTDFVPVSAPIKAIDGVSHRLEVYTDRLAIKRTDFLGWFSASNRFIPLADIVAVRIYESRFLKGASIQLAIIGRDHHSTALTFHLDQERALHAIKEQVEEMIHQRENAPMQPIQR